MQAERDPWGRSKPLPQFCSERCQDAYRKSSKRNVCPECSGPIYRKGDTRGRGKPRKFCSEVCKNAFDTRRLSRAVKLYDLMMGKRRDQDDPDHDKIQRTINRLRDEWDREDYRPSLQERQRTWYDWHRLIPNDLLAEDLPGPEIADTERDPEWAAQVAEAKRQISERKATEVLPEPRPLEEYVPPRPLRLQGLSGPSAKPTVIVEKRKRPFDR